jgi:class 3 adenylate cyclase
LRNLTPQDVAASTLLDEDEPTMHVRVGIHTGSAIAGIIGRKYPRFGVIGDTLNTALRLAYSAKPGQVRSASVAM